MQAFGNRGDVLVAFTTSGNSENVRRALVQAKSQNVATIAFLGRNGGSSAGIADIDLLVQGDNTARIQDSTKYCCIVFAK